MAEWINVVAEKEWQVTDTPQIVQSAVGAIAVFQLDGSYFAIEDVCSHDGGELASGRCEGDQIICPRHGARFCIRNGKALTPPAYEDIESFPVRVHDGMVQVDIDA
ncbi:MAG: ferredoxin [Zetaproteobacteria bacterium CG_4_9_14_3_um_filter_49_83]|nr:MAG: ferredoxin [Zetaproteobacteria bacterium CG1_02_49_23]PIQ33400.1 MAG: ferredoxin [Zetaproteobacteria bacterium CG17_big_fil_post_rev_8_21_14_2_50_50_13]PIV31611.1 MAG: ferredoxin [Zetaproteobacteria bacterium CG02_land_8_20_14_3_00_50_9]PIY55763.1 MAG: ferredoxin [Zetaproteobacteria bacterium CG_4_10_14_0_8_um_filter_49_80]PJA35083.1 MAG: ferredoxin [Zetaproteobacteria bacterium CG_4_9_14_3_um_filter_49_83]